MRLSQRLQQPSSVHAKVRPVAPLLRARRAAVLVRATAQIPKIKGDTTGANENGTGSRSSTPMTGPVYFISSMESCSVDESTEECSAFVDRDGDFVEIMCCDYGFRSGASRMYSEADDGKIPVNAFELAWRNFTLELRSLRESFRFDDYANIAEVNPPASPVGRAAYRVGQAVVDAFGALDRTLEERKVLEKLQPRPKTVDLGEDSQTAELLNECREIRSKLRQLKLSNQAVWDREHKREREGQGVETPWFIKGVYLSLCLLLDVLFNNRPIQRFWFLETVARMPYFSYISMLHLYESLGWWRAGAELRKIHFAEEWNELHHLQIMESLGGDQLWFDRFAAQHAAIVYYWILLGLYVFSPQLAYNFSELIEAHAVDTYGEFVDANEELLKSLPPPLVAAMYYRSSDLYMFDSFQTAQPISNPRRPACRTLYDVFCNIRDDELEHVKTMKACQDESVQLDIIARREDGPRVGV